MLRAAPLLLLLLALTALPASATGGARVHTCVTSSGVRSISFSATKYPNVRRHFRAALARGWPRTLVVNRQGADARRDRLLRGTDTRPGLDRDEYPPAVGRGRGKGLRRGRQPARLDGRRRATSRAPRTARTARPSATSCSRLCDGTRFRYVFY